MTERGAAQKISARLRTAGWQRLFGDAWTAAMRAHWAMQWYPRRLVEELQWKHIAEMVMHARRATEFYKDRLHHVHPAGALTLEEFRRIPPLTRRDLVALQSNPASAGSSHTVWRRQSGTTSGASVHVPLDLATYCWYIAGTWRGLRWWGAEISGRGAILLGTGNGGIRALATRAKDWVMNWIRITVDDRFDQHLPAILGRLKADDPTFIYGYPSAVDRLAQVARERGWTPNRSLKVVVLTGEPVFDFQRRRIAGIFQCGVAEEYGNSELGSMAFECAEGRLHVTTENVYLETVPQPSLGGDGAGLILATQLHNRLFPLLRYETGDLGTLERETCPCGRSLPIIRILGRARDKLMSHGGAQPARPRLETFFNNLPEGLQGRVCVTHGRPHAVVLQMERGVGAREHLAEVRAIAKSVFGDDWHIGIVEVDRLKRQRSGKLPYFVRMHTH